MDKTYTKEDQILATARELFAKYGYKRVSMDEIARDANVVKSTIYQHFKDKDELLEFIINETISEMQKMVEKIKKESNSPFEVIHKTVYQLLMYREQQELLVTIAKEAEDFHNQKLATRLESVDKSILSYIEEELEKGMREKVIRKCQSRVVAYVLFQTYISLIKEWKKENKPLNEKDIADSISLFLKTGLLV